MGYIYSAEFGAESATWNDALADQVRERVPNLLRRALVAQAPGERLDQPVRALGRLAQDRPAVGACLLLVELGDQRLVEQIRGTEQSVAQCRSSRKGLRGGQNACEHHFYHTEAPVSLPGSGPWCMIRASVPNRRSVRSRLGVAPWRIGAYLQPNSACCGLTKAPATTKQLRMQDTKRRSSGRRAVGSPRTWCSSCGRSVDAS